MTTGSVEAFLTNGGYGGDLVLTPQGDLTLVQDTQVSAAATVQRIVRLIFTNPRLFGSSGQPICRPDDRFNPKYGSGARALIGEMITPQLLYGIQTRVLSALASDPYIAKNPAPTVNVENAGGGAIIISGDQQGNLCYTITGQPVTIPPQQLQIFGG